LITAVVRLAANLAECDGVTITDDAPHHPGLDQVLFFSSRRLNHLVTEVLAAHHLTVAGWWLISSLAEADGQALGELARQGGWAASTMTVTADGLAKRGFVDRRRSTGTRRGVFLRLTAEGHRVRQGAAEDLDQVLGPAFRDLYQPDELRVLVALLSRMGELSPGHVPLARSRS
jgi:DNA-binding MarR family transcriptional regulator